MKKWALGPLLLTVSISAIAAERVALVIGNSAYPSNGLRNPVNDAGDLDLVLKDLNFDVVSVLDGDKRTMDIKINEFLHKLNSHTKVALFFYSGHGSQYKGVNYLLPVNANLQNASTLPSLSSVTVQSILKRMDAKRSGLNIMIIDACRTSPYQGVANISGKSASQMKGNIRGLERVFSSNQMPSIIAYATSSGQVAKDGDGNNSPYTTELLKFIKQPKVSIGQVFNNISVAIRNKTNKRQVPWNNTSAIPNIFLATKLNNTRPRISSSSTSSNGDSNAQLQAAYKRKDYSTVYRIASEFAKKGDKAGQYILGELYMQGQGVQKNAWTAGQWYKKAAAQNHPSAMFSLGSIYVTGVGAKKNPALAFQFYTKAAAKGVPDAYRGLGIMYENGEGTAKNMGTAIHWYEKAANKGMTDVQIMLSERFLKGVGVAKNYGKAFNYAKKAEKSGKPAVNYLLGLMYLEGKGIKKNPYQAFQLLSKSAKQGVSESMFLLGDLYVDGIGVKKNHGQALAWYRKAANKGVPLAIYSVGAMYANGYGVKRDLRQARIWFEKAAAKNVPAAKKALQRLNGSVGDWK